MAEDDIEELEDEAAKPAATRAEQSSLLRYLPLLLVVLLLQAGGAYFAMDRYLLKTDEMGMITAQDETGRPRTIPEGDEPEASVDLGVVIANPRSEGAKILVRAVVTLAVAPDDARGEIEREQNIDRVKDAVVFELGNASPQMLGNREGRAQVKDRIKDRINGFLYEGQVVAVYFGEFVLQALAGYEE